MLGEVIVATGEGRDDLDVLERCRQAATRADRAVEPRRRSRRSLLPAQAGEELVEVVDGPHHATADSECWPIWLVAPEVVARRDRAGAARVAARRASVSPPITFSGVHAGTSSSAFPAETIESASGTQSVRPGARRARIRHLGDDRRRSHPGLLARADGEHGVRVGVAAGVGRHDGAVGAEADGRLGCGGRGSLLVLGRLLVAAHQHDAREPQSPAVLAIERAHERVALEHDGGIAETSPVVLAAGHGAVEELRRIDRARQPGLPYRHAVEVLVVERARGRRAGRAPRPTAGSRRQGRARRSRDPQGRRPASAGRDPRRRQASSCAPTPRAPRCPGRRAAGT